MAIQPFLAMTAAEMWENSRLPPKIAWMACHFSPYGLGLSNLPDALPKGSLLIVDDVTPPHGHDPVFMANQLSECVESLQCCGVLLDFQRCGCSETKAITEYLVKALPCPVAVSEGYAREMDCGVFLSAATPSVALEDHLAPWKDREIWLELGLEGEAITLTEQGAETVALPYWEPEAPGFQEEGFHCHYNIQIKETSATFTLWRTEEDIRELLAEAEDLGVAGVVGLYQELRSVGWGHDPTGQMANTAG